MAPVFANDLTTFFKYLPATSLARLLPVAVSVFSKAVTVGSTSKKLCQVSKNTLG